MKMLMTRVVPKAVVMFFIAFSINTTVCFSQDIIVVGQVVSQEDSSALEHALVWFKGTQISTFTNAEGYFFLTSSVPRKTIVASMLGYEPKETKLNRQKQDQMLHIALTPEVKTLKELTVRPSKNKAKWLLSNLDKNRDKNNPDNILGFSIEKNQQKKLYFTNISKEFFDKKFFSSLKSGVLIDSSSNAVLPIYFSEENITENRSEDSISLVGNKQKYNAIEIFERSQLEAVISSYSPQVNFYEPNIMMLGKSFVSPTSKQGLLFYNYYITDSIEYENSSVYEVIFAPRNSKFPLFKGKMWIDSKTFALKKIEATVPKSANINFVKDLHFEQKFSQIDSTRYFYSDVSQSIGFSYTFFPGLDDTFFSALLKRSSKYYSPRFFSSHNLDKPHYNKDIEKDSDRNFSDAIDSINNSKFQRITHKIIDAAVGGYVDVGAMDFGPVFNFIRYNALEGFRPTISLRTNRKAIDFASLSLFAGYGFGDRDLKYGASFQIEVGEKKMSRLGIFFNSDVYRLGYDNKALFNENMIGGTENLLSSFSWGQVYNKLYKSNNMSLLYRFKHRDISFSVVPKYSRLYANRFVKFKKDTINFRHIDIASVSASVRFSFEQKSINRFFNTFYLPTIYPIVQLMAEGGYSDVNFSKNYFFKTTVAIKHTFPFAFGKIIYSIQGVKIFGKAPYPILESPLAVQGLWHNFHSFNLINQEEFLSDLFASASFRYHTNGLLFSNIPYVKEFNLRETVFGNIAWGSLSNQHSRILDIPAKTPLSTPYVEVGVGITNILSLISIESIWRVTHRNLPNVIKWGVRVKIYLDF